MSAPAWGPADFQHARDLIRQQHNKFLNWQCRAGVCQCSSLESFFLEQRKAVLLKEETCDCVCHSGQTILHDHACCERCLLCSMFVKTEFVEQHASHHLE